MSAEVIQPHTTLDEWASNGKGGFLAWRVCQFLYFSTTRKMLTQDECEKIVEEAQEKARLRRGQ